MTFIIHCFSLHSFLIFLSIFNYFLLFLILLLFYIITPFLNHPLLLHVFFLYQININVCFLIFLKKQIEVFSFLLLKKQLKKTFEVFTIIGKNPFYFISFSSYSSFFLTFFHYHFTFHFLYLFQPPIYLFLIIPWVCI